MDAELEIFPEAIIARRKRQAIADRQAERIRQQEEGATEEDLEWEQGDDG